MSDADIPCSSSTGRPSRARARAPKYVDDDYDEEANDAGSADERDDESASAGATESAPDDDDEDVPEDSDDDKPRKKAKKAPTAKAAAKPKAAKAPAKVRTPPKSTGGKGKAAAGGARATPAAAASAVSGSSTAASAGKRPASSMSSATPALGVALPKPSNEKEAEEYLLTYLRRTNRPYSALNVFDNTHGAVGKTVVPRVLDKLADEGRIASKVYGKFKLYWASQADYTDVSPEQMNALSAEVKELETAAAAAAATRKSKAATLSALQNSMTKEELAAALSKSRATVAEMEAKLAKFKSGSGVVLVTPQQRAAAKATLDKYRRAWVDRKRMVTELLDALSEGMNKHPRVLSSEIGIETDEDAKVNVKDFTA